MFSELLDHGLPLVALKERRRELIGALKRRDVPLSEKRTAEIAAIQQVIAAIEAVICDLDAEITAFEKPVLALAINNCQAH